MARSIPATPLPVSQCAANVMQPFSCFRRFGGKSRCEICGSAWPPLRQGSGESIPAMNQRISQNSRTSGTAGFIRRPSLREIAVMDRRGSANRNIRARRFRSGKGQQILRHSASNAVTSTTLRITIAPGIARRGSPMTWSKVMYYVLFVGTAVMTAFIAHTLLAQVPH
jgi:hypothetical protein